LFPITSGAGDRGSNPRDPTTPFFISSLQKPNFGTGASWWNNPAVLEVAVIPVPHENWGEVPKALVVLKHV
jgi:acyl-CoA synthetase (AMP-forming)/AMP-acid ligase II